MEKVTRRRGGKGTRGRRRSQRRTVVAGGLDRRCLSIFVHGNSLSREQVGAGLAGDAALEVDFWRPDGRSPKADLLALGIAPEMT